MWVGGCSNAKAGPWSMEEIEQLIAAMETIPYGKWSRVQQEKNFHHRSQVGHPATFTSAMCLHPRF